MTVIQVLHRGKSIAQPDILLVQRGGRPVVMKDYSRRPALVRLLFGRPILRREARVLSLLDGIVGIPRFLGWQDKDRLFIECVEGRGRLRCHRETTPDAYPAPEFFTRLKTLLAEIHVRGLAHGDVHRSNILRGPDDVPYLIDFASAVVRHGRLGFVRRPLFNMVALVDRTTLLKLQRSYYPETLTAAENALLDNPPWYLSLGRFMRKRLYRKIIKQRTWERRLQRLTRTRTCPADTPK